MTEPESQSGEDALQRARHSQRRAWASGQSVSVEQLLNEFPELSSQEDAILELAYSEFCLREQAGESPEADEYYARFASLNQPLRRMFEVHAALDSAALDSVPETLSNQDITGAVVQPSFGPDADLSASSFHASNDPRALSISGRVLGDFELLEELGRGGMGTVYLARQISIDRLVAVKTIIAGPLAGPREVSRFLREVEAAARLDHPGIVPIYEFGQEQGYYFFSMPRVNGPNLSSRLAAGRLSIRESAELICKLASALQYAHDHGIVHRDLTPANVLIDSDQQPRITDFGLARKMETTEELTVTGDLLGTPAYMSPEQAAGHANQVRETTDIFALGSILYLLITGRSAFQDSTPLKTLSRVIHSDPQPPRQLNTQIPRDLATICLRCLEKKTADRYQSADAVERDLRAFLAGESIAARPVTRLQRARRWCQRRPVVASLSVALVSVILTSLAGASYAAFHYLRLNRQHVNLRFQTQDQNDRYANEQKQTRRQRDAAQNEVARAKRNTTQTRRQLYETRFELALSAWQDGNLAQARKVLTVQRPHSNQVDYRNFEWFWLQRLCQATRFSETLKGATLAWDFHPDGHLLATIVDGQTEATIWQPENQSKLRTLRHARPVRIVRFSPDGRQIATSTADGEIVLWDSETGNRIWQANRYWWPWTNLTTSTLRFTADGKRLVWANTGRSHARIWDTATGQLQHEFPFLKTGRTHHICGDASGEFLAVAAADGLIAVWNVSTGKQVVQWKPQGGLCHHIALNHDGSLLAAAQANQTLSVFDAQTGSTRWSLRSQHGTVEQLSFRPHDVILAARNSDDTVTLWNARNGNAITTLKTGEQPLTQVGFTPGGGQLATASGSGPTRAQVSLWRVLGMRAAHIVRRSTTRPAWLATSPQDAWLAVARHSNQKSNPCSVSIWNLDQAADAEHSDTPRQVIPLPAVPVSGLFSRDGRRLVLAYRDGRICERDLESGQAVRETALADSAVAGPRQSTLALRPDGGTAVASHSNGRVTITDTFTEKQVVQFAAHDGPLTQIALSPDGSRLLTVVSSMIKLWDLPSAKPLWFRAETDSSIVCHGFSADGNRIVLADSEGGLSVVDAVAGKALRTFSAGSSRPRQLCLNADGSRIVTSDGDQIVRIWDADTGRAVCRLPKLSGVVTRVAFTGDGHWLVIASDDGTLHFYDGRPDPKRPDAADTR